MNVFFLLTLVIFLITFVSLLAVSNPSDGSGTRGMADYGVSNQGCIGGCLMFPIILIVRPIEFLASAIGTASSAKDNEALKKIGYMAIGSLMFAMLLAWFLSAQMHVR